MNKLKSFLVTSKILLISSILLAIVFTSGQNAVNFTQAVFTSSIKAVSNRLETGYWQPATPAFEGFNLPTESALPNDQPLDLGCGVLTNGGDPLHPRVALNWQAISGARIVYQREVTYPSGVVAAGFYETDNYTDFITLGSDAGINGLWRFRVRAFEDVDDSGTFTSGDVASGWSNYCNFTLDSLGPDLAFTNIPSTSSLLVTNNTVTLKGTVTDPHLADYQVKIYELDLAGNPVGDPVADSSQITTADSSFERDLYVWDVSGLNGFYLVKLIASDSLANSSSIDQVVKVINPDPVDSTITVTNSPEKEIVNRVKNSSFEENLADWQFTGEVNIQQAAAIGGAVSGGQIVQLSSLENTNSLADNTLTQIIDNQGKGLRSISFWYKLVSQATDLGANQPAFEVWVNDWLKFQNSASGFTHSYSGLTKNGWQMMSIYVGDIEADQLKLTFKAGTLVYLDQITTDVTAVNKEALFTIYSQDPTNTAQVFYQYQLAGQTIQGQGLDGLSFNLLAQPDNQALFFWTINNLGIEAEKNKIEVIFDQFKPSTIFDLKAYDEGEGEYTLAFSAPYDNIFSSVRSYDVRYSTQAIDDKTDWNSLAQATLLETDSLISHAQAPLSAGSKEELVAIGLDSNENYYFAIKSIDVAGNLSALSNVALTQVAQNQAGTISSPIVINEILYDPEGDDGGNWQDGEWIELYNTGNTDINLAGWFIADTDGKKVVIGKDNSDNNLNQADDGETIIPSHGWLVVYKNGTRFLNNDGDSLVLYNLSNLLVDVYSYQALAPEGQTEARQTDGSDEWSFISLATPGRPNAVNIIDLQPQVRLYQQEMNTAMIKVFDAVNYQTANYTLVYSHLYEGQKVTEALIGQVEVNNNQLEINDLYLGTCSSKGACTPHLGIDADSMVLTVSLQAEDDREQILTVNLTGDWQE